MNIKSPLCISELQPLLNPHALTLMTLDPSDQQRLLSNNEINRYGRQLILPEIGIHGQSKLKQASVLIVGAGGLGAPAAMYLAAAGVGRIGLMDYDSVEISNLHRQVIHSESMVGVPKVTSASHALRRLNSNVQYAEYPVELTPTNAAQIIEQYDVVLDCSDNVATRYLLNDTCVVLDKPLVSGSALRFEGQLTVYHYNNGPCYRCIFPKPPPPDSVTNCSDGGVCGPVTGCIGSLQALEAIKIITAHNMDVYAGRLLIMHAWMGAFKVIKLRPKQPNCVACGTTPRIDHQLMDYLKFCHSTSVVDKNPSIQLLDPKHRISATQLSKIIGRPHPSIGHSAQLDPSPANSYLIIDVRPNVQFDIVHIPGSINIPYSTLPHRMDEIRHVAHLSLIIVCRRGNDSQLAAYDLLNNLECANVVDVIGGLEAWRVQIDDRFPCY